MGKVSYRPKRNQGRQEVKKQYNSKKVINETLAEEKVEDYEGIQVKEKISVTSNHRNKKNTEQLESIKVVGDMDCTYHIYVEDYVYTYIYQLAASDLAKESSAILIGEIYSDSKEAIIRGVIPVNMDKLSDEAEWIDIKVAEEAEAQRKNYFKDQDIIGWMHMQPGYGTMLTMKELREHQNVFEGDGTLCMLVDAINKIETVYVYEDEELKEQSGYCMYYERNEEMQQYMLEHPFSTGTKEEMKDTVVNQFREIGKMRKAEYTQRKNLNLTVIASSIILIALTAVIVKMNEGRGYNEKSQVANSTSIFSEDLVQTEPISSEPLLSEDLSPNNVEAVGEEQALVESQNTKEQLPTDISGQEIEKIQAVVPEENDTPLIEQNKEEVEESVETEEKVSEDYTTYVVQKGDTLADICYKEYGNAKRSLEVAQYNGLTDTNQIYVGQELKMPK